MCLVVCGEMCALCVVRCVPFVCSEMYALLCEVRCVPCCVR